MCYVLVWEQDRPNPDAAALQPSSGAPAQPAAWPDQQGLMQQNHDPSDAFQSQWKAHHQQPPSDQPQGLVASPTVTLDQQMQQLQRQRQQQQQPSQMPGKQRYR